MEESNGRNRFTLDLPPAGGRVLVFLPETIGGIDIGSSDTLDPVRGKWHRLSARLTGNSGHPVPGIIPVRVDIRGPGDRPLDLSRYDAFTNGEWSLDLPISFNQPAGTYQLTLTELASGIQSRYRWVIE